MGERRGVYRERDHLKDSGVDGRIMLRWTFMRRDVGVWTGLIWFRIGTCECGIEPSDSINTGNFLTS
jgi:hypothetical protein